MSRDALDVIKKFDTKETLHYLDPPYVAETRKEPKLYKYEMTDEQHEQLGQLLNQVKGKVILSGYDSPLYAKLYKGWRVDRRVQKLNCSRDKSQSRTEVVWMNW